MSCPCILQSGIREGRPCGAKEKLYGRCGRHQKTCILPQRRSPKRKSPSKRTPPSPRRKSPTPKRRSPSPRKSPKRRSPSPKRKSPAPKRKSPSPKPTPKRRSPVQQKRIPKLSPSKQKKIPLNVPVFKPPPKRKTLRLSPSWASPPKRSPIKKRTSPKRAPSKKKPTSPVRRSPRRRTQISPSLGLIVEKTPERKRVLPKRKRPLRKRPLSEEKTWSAPLFAPSVQPFCSDKFITEESTLIKVFGKAGPGLRLTEWGIAHTIENEIAIAFAKFIRSSIKRWEILNGIQIKNPIITEVYSEFGSLTVPLSFKNSQIQGIEKDSCMYDILKYNLEKQGFTQDPNMKNVLRFKGNSDQTVRILVGADNLYQHLTQDVVVAKLYEQKSVNGAANQIKTSLNTFKVFSIITSKSLNLSLIEKIPFVEILKEDKNELTFISVIQRKATTPYQSPPYQPSTPPILGVSSPYTSPPPLPPVDYTIGGKLVPYKSPPYRPSTPTSLPLIETSSGKALVPYKSEGGALVPYQSKGGALVPYKSEGGALVPYKSGGGALVPYKTEGGALVPYKSEGGALVPYKSEGGALVPYKSRSSELVSSSPVKPSVGEFDLANFVMSELPLKAFVNGKRELSITEYPKTSQIMFDEGLTKKLYDFESKKVGVTKSDIQIAVPAEVGESFAHFISNCIEFVQIERSEIVITEIGTGTGALTLALAQSFPSAYIQTVEIDPQRSRLEDVTKENTFYKFQKKNNIYSVKGSNQKIEEINGDYLDVMDSLHQDVIILDPSVGPSAKSKARVRIGISNIDVAYIIRHLRGKFKIFAIIAPINASLKSLMTLENVVVISQEYGNHLFICVMDTLFEKPPISWTPESSPKYVLPRDKDLLTTSPIDALETGKLNILDEYMQNPGIEPITYLMDAAVLAVDKYPEFTLKWLKRVQNGPKNSRWINAISEVFKRACEVGDVEVVKKTYELLESNSSKYKNVAIILKEGRKEAFDRSFLKGGNREKYIEIVKLLKSY